MREHICRHLRRASTQTTTPQHCSRSQILSLSKMQAWEYHPLVLCFLMRIHGALGNNVAVFDWTVHIKWSQNPRGPFLGSVSREIGLFILAKLLSIMYRRSTCPEDKLHGTLGVYSVWWSLSMLTMGHHTEQWACCGYHHILLVFSPCLTLENTSVSTERIFFHFFVILKAMSKHTKMR